MERGIEGVTTFHAPPCRYAERVNNTAKVRPSNGRQEARTGQRSMREPTVVRVIRSFDGSAPERTQMSISRSEARAILAYITSITRTVEP
jgi:hypothetical protein